MLNQSEPLQLSKIHGRMTGVFANTLTAIGVARNE